MNRPADLSSWKHCPICATGLELRSDPSQRVSCPNCGFKEYDHPRPTTIVLIRRDDGKVLLLKRANDPRGGHWDTVGGFVDGGESAEDGARREAREEIGCELASLTAVGTYTSVYGDGGPRTLGVTFTATLAEGSEIRLSDENSECGWFGADELPEMAFPDGRDALEDLFRS